MSLDKSIQHGKEYRKPYREQKQWTELAAITEAANGAEETGNMLTQRGKIVQ